jgi:hypothetical protein
MLIRKDYQESAVPQAFCGFSEKKLNFFLLIHKYDQLFDDIYYSRAHFARVMGVSPKTIDRWCEDYNNLGVMTKTQPPGRPFDTCHYKLTELGHAMKAHALNLYKFAKYIFLPISILTMQPTLEKTNVQLYSSPNDLSIYLKVYSTLQESINERARDLKQQLSIKKERVMNQQWLTPQLQTATDKLNLTKWGQIRLSAYPAQAIEHSLKVFNSSKTAKNDLFRWFSSVCNEWCKKNNSEPNWALMRSLAIENEMPDDPVLFREKQSISIPQAQPMKQSAQDELFKRVSGEIRKKNQERIALNDPEDIRKQREYLLSAPSWVQMGREKGVDMSRWGLDKTVEQAAPVKQWSLADQQLINWLIGYIDIKKQNKQFYKPFLDEIALGPDSPRARSGELMEGFRIMREMADKEAARLNEKNLVTQKSVEIVLDTIEADDERLLEAIAGSVECGEWEEVF